MIERETIKPVVVHTTNHVHETHHLKAEHHGATTAPAISLSEFEKTGAEGVSAAKSDIKAGAKADVKGAETTAVKVKEDVAAVKDKKTVGAVKTKVDNKEGTTANVNPTIT